MFLSFLEVVTGFGGGWSQVSGRSQPSGLYPNQLSEAYPLSFFPIGCENLGAGF
jgi:hypothetical protein